MGAIRIASDGKVVERLADHGDGTATRTTWDDAGQPVKETVELVPDPPAADPPLLVQLVEAVGLPALRSAVVVGAGLAERADELIVAVDGIDPSNTARGAVGILAAAVSAAATTEIGEHE